MNARPRQGQLSTLDSKGGGFSSSYFEVRTFPLAQVAGRSLSYRVGRSVMAEQHDTPGLPNAETSGPPDRCVSTRSRIIQLLWYNKWYQ